MKEVKERKVNDLMVEIGVMRSCYPEQLIGMLRLTQPSLALTSRPRSDTSGISRVTVTVTAALDVYGIPWISNTGASHGTRQRVCAGRSNANTTNPIR